MLFSYNWLQSFFEKKLPDAKELECLIIKHCFEVEGVEKSGKDTVLDINILSNRPDCFAHVGIAREIGAVIGLKMIMPKIKIAGAKNAFARTLIGVEVLDTDACPRYCAKVITGVKVGPAPKWMQERLIACGLRPINNIVDATNYVMLESGQPLHAFDLDKLAGSGNSKIKKIFVRRADNGEEIISLDDKNYKLDSSMLVIADGQGPLAIAGIKGGKRAQIDSGTKAIVIEAANFNPRIVRFASRNLGLRTDASLRFEHGLDSNVAEIAANRVATLILEIAGGQILNGIVDSYPKKVKPRRVTLGLEAAESLLGTNIQTAQIKKILESLGFSVRKGTGLNFDVLVPTNRADVNLSQDLIEEVGRISGYDEINPRLPMAVVLPPAKNYFWQWKNVAKNALVQSGYSETRNNSFLCKNDCVIFGAKVAELLEVKNPVNADLQFMRPSLLPGLFKNSIRNSQLAQLRQFEIGKIFGAGLRMEPTMLAGIDRGSNFFEVKGALEYVCNRLRVTGFRCVPLGMNVNSLFNAPKASKIIVNNKEIGVMGEVSRETCERFGIEPLIAFELSMDVLSVMASEENKYRPISIYPEAIRDISIDVPVKTLAEEVIRIIKMIDSGKLIKTVEIIGDPYVLGSSKNILFRFHLHSDLKTLETDEIGDWQRKTIKEIELNPEWKVKR